MVIIDKYKKLTKIISINCGISSFNNACCGAIIYLLLGLYGLPLWVSLIKLIDYISDLYRCRLQHKLATKDIQYLNNRYLKIQYIETMISVLGYLLLIKYIYIGLCFILLMTCLNSLTRAYFIAYSTLVDDTITNKTASNRTQFYAYLDMIANCASIIGTVINGLIYYICSKYSVPNITVYHSLCIFYSITKIIDLLCSIIEKSEIDKLIRS